MIDQKVYYLSKVDLFTDLNTQELTELAEKFLWEEYEAGSEIMLQGQENHRFFVLISGKAVSLVSKRGRGAVQVASFEPGSIFGEKSLVTGKTGSATVRCLTSCTVLTLDSEHFARMLVRWPKLYQCFVEKLSQHLCELNLDLWESKQKEFLNSALQTTKLEQKFYGIWGSTKTTREVEAKLVEFANTKGHLILIGERGAGRQMFAWYLHKQTFGEKAPFVVVEGTEFDTQWGDMVFENPAAEDSMADAPGSSLLDIAENGTLLIREIDLLSPRVQLRLAESLTARKLKCRIIATLNNKEKDTSHSIIPELREHFSQKYMLTPLRERKRDIPVIAQGIIDKLAVKHNRQPPVLTQEATNLLLSHNYRHGNVTELIQVVERAFFLAEQDVISLEHVFFGPTAEKGDQTFNLLSIKWVEKLLKAGTLILTLQHISAIIFALLCLLLVFAPETQVAAISLALSWGIWWPTLAIISPLFGRIWCIICPFSFIMGQIQKKIHLNLPVPNLLKQYNFLFITFFFLLINWSEIITEMHKKPLLTALLLLGILVTAVITGIIFPRHTYCHHLCPLGGFIGMASIGSILEVRSDTAFCQNKCTTYDCYKGRDGIPGCPMSQHAPYIDNNLACKLCFNCIRSCPNGAIQLNLRFPAREVWHLVRVNQGFVIFIGVTLAILVPIFIFQPLGTSEPLPNWKFWFSLTYWLTALAAGLLTWLIAKPFKTKGASRRIKLFFSYIPLVLAGYIAYKLHFLPGANTLLLGWATQPVLGQQQTYFVSALTVGQITALIVGLLLSGFAVIMVYVHNKKPS